MFIKVTAMNADRNVRFNVDKLVYYCACEGGTALVIDGETELIVQEQPEEIDAKIERVTNHAIGGGH